MGKRTSPSFIHLSENGKLGSETYAVNRQARSKAKKMQMRGVMAVTWGPLHRVGIDPDTKKPIYERDGEVFEPQYRPSKVKPNKYREGTWMKEVA